MANESRRSRGGQPGNQNAWKHGERSRQQQIANKTATAMLKGLAIIGRHLKMFDDSRSVRRKPLRPDQMELIEMANPRLAATILRHGLYLPARYAHLLTSTGWL
jgi:hypothetical protein